MIDYTDISDFNFKYYFRPNNDLEGYDLIKRVTKVKNDDTKDDIWVATIYELDDFSDYLHDCFEIMEFNKHGKD